MKITDIRIDNYYTPATDNTVAMILITFENLSQKRLDIGMPIDNIKLAEAFRKLANSLEEK